VSTEIQTVRDIMLPLPGFPCMKESGTVQEAIRQLRSFCPIGSTGPCGFSDLMIVDDQGRPDRPGDPAGDPAGPLFDPARPCRYQKVRGQNGRVQRSVDPVERGSDQGRGQPPQRPGGQGHRERHSGSSASADLLHAMSVMVIVQGDGAAGRGKRQTGGSGPTRRGLRSPRRHAGLDEQ